MNVNRCFYYTRAECHFSFVVSCHSFQFPFRHHHVFSKVKKHSVLVFFQKGPKCCTLHMKVLFTQTWSPARKRMNDRKKKKKTIIETPQEQCRFIPRSRIGGGKGAVSDLVLVGFLFFGFLVFGVFFLAATTVVNQCHSIFPAQGKLGSKSPQDLLQSDRVAVGRLSLGWPHCHGPQGHWC